MDTFHLSYQDTVYAEWVQTVNDVVKVNLERPLLIRAKKTNCISVNFNPQVPRMCCFCGSGGGEGCCG